MDKNKGRPLDSPVRFLPNLPPVSIFPVTGPLNYFCGFYPALSSSISADVSAHPAVIDIEIACFLTMAFYFLFRKEINHHGSKRHLLSSWNTRQKPRMMSLSKVSVKLETSMRKTFSYYPAYFQF